VSVLYSWDKAAARWEAAEPTAAAVALADSWLLEEGRTTRLDLHRERFLAGAAELGDAAEPEAAWDAFAPLMPQAGRWFPRVDLLSDGELMLALRPAPPREPNVVAWLMPDPDPRLQARRKGPELELLGELRAQAREHGAGEAVLIDDQGQILEGAYSSLLWWEGDVLYAVPDDAPALPGITRHLLLEIAAEDGVEIGYLMPRPSDLAGREVWLVGSLHGIRAVSEWAGDGLPAGAPIRAHAWQQRLDQLQG
jgi:branched-subunit amino acid aminotransferase/4-amino-4-deoxychorismate lyase